jgi:hypothetical protein
MDIDVTMDGIWVCHINFDYLDPNPSPFVRSILNKERGGTFEKTFTLKKPSFIVTTCFEIGHLHLL